MIISISGPPGSGKTTAAELFAKKHHFRLVSAGRIFRNMARARGMTLDEFGLHAMKDHSIDVKVDKKVMDEVRKLAGNGEDVIIDGRLAGHFLAREKIPSFKVWLEASGEVRARRIAGRESKDAGLARKEVQRRERVEKSRYREIYNFDLDDISIYDLVIDTSEKTPEEIVDIVASRALK